MLPDIILSASGDLESCRFKLNLKFTRPILLGVIYKPPKIPVGYTIRTLTEILSKIQPAEPHELYILGDFNIDTSDPSSLNAQKLKWFCIKNGKETNEMLNEN